MTRGLKTLTLACLLLSASALRAWAAPGEIAKEAYESDGKKRTYYLYVPKVAAASSAPVPLLVTLHGSGRDGRSLVEKWKDLADKEGFIVAGPDSLGRQGWNVPKDGPDGTYDLVETVKAKHPVDPRRVYLFGHSAGAGFALMISLLESEYFAAAAVHAGLLSPANYDLIETAKRKTPIAMMVGAKDPLFPLADVRATRDELNRRGFAVQLSEIPNHDHWYYDRAPEFNRALWDFLKQHRLDADPRYVRYNFTK
jgi:poly(3-hydroxybutyrate) depolymerase